MLIIIDLKKSRTRRGMIAARRMMGERMTIIEGPPPVFEKIDDGWALGLNESPAHHSMALTRLRTFNGPVLVERWPSMWNENERSSALP